MDNFFHPTSIAIIGASKDETKRGTVYLNSLLRLGYEGNIYPINPRENEISGIKSYPSVAHVPGDIDIAIIALPARIVPGVVAECCDKGIRFVIVHSAGFSELGDNGKKLEEEMLRPLKDSQTRLVGPNCMGLYSPKMGINTIVSHIDYEKITGPIAFIGQSGWATENYIQIGSERGLRFSKVVNIGNQSDLTIEDFLTYLAKDPETKVIGLYVEGIKNGRYFMDVIQEAILKKPIIAWKAGITERGIRAAASHTGSIAGDAVILDTVFQQKGITTARNFDELIDYSVAFTSPILPRGKRVGFLVGSGGGGVTGTDTAESLGLEVPTLSAEAQDELNSILTGVIPPFSPPINPVDLVWGGSLQLNIKCAKIILREVDSLIIMLYSILDSEFANEMSALRDETNKPIIIIPAHPAERREGIGLLPQYGIPTFVTPERAVRSLAMMVHYYNSITIK